MKNKVFLIFLSVILAISAFPITAFADNYADTVVYGTVRTADTKNPIAEAIAIKNGKFLYVGNETGVSKYIQKGITKIIDHRGKGMIMPGCTDGHSHYTMKFGMESMKGGIIFDIEDDKAAVLQKLEKATLEAKNAGKQTLFGFGWNFLYLMADSPSLAELDAVTHGVSTIIFDQGGHHAFCNSECLKRAGIIDGKGGVLINEIDGGYLKLDDNGYPTGYSEERVTGYLMRMGGIDYNEIIDDQIAETSILKTQDILLSTGYTMALDGWSNMLHPSKLYAAANRLDKEGKLKFVFPMTYEVEPWQTDIDKEINNLDSLNKIYGTSHVLPKYLKLFMDGVVETKTGALLNTYKDGTSYNSFWSVDRLADITKKCNEKDLTVHVHAMGDAAIKETVDAYIKGGDKDDRNCIVHLRNVSDEDFERLAKNNIACSAGMTWHVDGGDVANAYYAEFLEQEYINQAYPIKSFFDAGVKVSSHSDYPANEPSPQDPFGIMEIAVTGQIEDPASGKMLPVYDKDELITINQAFQALTINGAWQLGLEKERGSIEVGKWADFVLTDRDIFTCLKTDISKTNVVSTWFEGNLVYSALDTKTTRGEMITMLWRMADSPVFEDDQVTFTDIKKTDYFYDAVIWGWNMGIISGKSTNAFAPDDKVTRGETVTFLYRYAKVAGGDLPNPFEDVKQGEFYYYPVLWAANNGITTGITPTIFNPNGDCTSVQLETFLDRYNIQYNMR